MKTNYLLLTILSSLTLFACGGSGDKSLFSSWESVPAGSTVNLSGGSIGSFPMTWVLTNGSSCLSTIVLSGTEDAGSAVVSGTIGGAGCSSLNGTYSFTKANSQLTVCKTGCTTYQ